MTLVFVVGVAISAIFQSAEIVRLTRETISSLADKQWSLHKDHPDRKSLLRNSIIKLAVVGVAIVCAIAFGVTYGLVSSHSGATMDYS
jgi:hypothetical protein